MGGKISKISKAAVDSSSAIKDLNEKLGTLVGPTKDTLDEVSKGVATASRAADAVTNFSKEAGKLVEPTQNVLDAAKVAALAFSFAQVTIGLWTVVKILSGQSAKEEFLKLGGQIQRNVEEVAKGIDTINNQYNQRVFPRHVHEFVSMCTKEQTTSAIDSYFFVYHPGTDWHAHFCCILEEKPLPKFCGIFNDMATMEVFLKEFRQAIGPKPTIHILIPAVHLFLIPDEILIPEELYPLQIRGELHQSGKPYVYVNIPNIPRGKEETLYRIANISKGTKVTWRRTLWATSLAIAAGAPATAGGALGGAMVGVALIVGASTPLVVPALVGFGLTTVGGGAAAGAAAGIKVRRVTENNWDKKFGYADGSLTGLHLLERIRNHQMDTRGEKR